MLLRQCVNESNQMQDNLSDDIKQLMVLNAELETAVEVLKGEIWSLSGQLKAVKSYCMDRIEVIF